MNPYSITATITHFTNEDRNEYMNQPSPMYPTTTNKLSSDPDVLILIAFEIVEMNANPPIKNIGTIALKNGASFRRSKY